jgi:hypothetical protein
MASSIQLVDAFPTTLPATLPDDFGEWDDNSQSAQPAEFLSSDPIPESVTDPNPDPRLAAAPQPHRTTHQPAQIDASRNRHAAPTQKAYTSDKVFCQKSFLDQLISMNQETEAEAEAPESIPAPVATSIPTPTPTSPGAIFEVVPPRSSTDRIHLEPSRPQPAELAEQRPAPALFAAFEPAPGRNRSRKLIVAVVALVFGLLSFFAVGRASRHASPVRPTSPPPAAPAAASSATPPAP